MDGCRFPACRRLHGERKVSIIGADVSKKVDGTTSATVRRGRPYQSKIYAESNSTASHGIFNAERATEILGV